MQRKCESSDLKSIILTLDEGFWGDTIKNRGEFVQWESGLGVDIPERKTIYVVRSYLMGSRFKIKDFDLRDEHILATRLATLRRRNLKRSFNKGKPIRMILQNQQEDLRRVEVEGELKGGDKLLFH